MVTIIDYGIGNLRSIEKAFQRIGATVLRADDAADLRAAERLVLPGVGAFGACMQELRDRGLVAPIHEAIAAGTPFLGVCIGLQLLFEESDERGTHEGLGVLPGRVVRFPNAQRATELVDQDTAGNGQALKVPHMGWNNVTATREHPLLHGLSATPYFYFVHSYYAEAEAPADVLATAHYGVDFPAIVHRNNVLGVQFHPEKSHDSGLQVLKNFTSRVQITA